MTQTTEEKALALVNEIEHERGEDELTPRIMRGLIIDEALCRAIEQHEAFRQELHDFKHKVSFAVEDVMERDLPVAVLRRFVIGADKPDALVDVWGDLFAKAYNLDQFCDALEARGLEIREKGQ